MLVLLVSTVYTLWGEELTTAQEVTLEHNWTAEHSNSSENVKRKCRVPGACKPSQLLALRRVHHAPYPHTPHTHSRSVQTAGVICASSGWNASRLKHSNRVHVNTGWVLHEECKQQWRKLMQREGYRLCERCLVPYAEKHHKHSPPLCNRRTG